MHASCLLFKENEQRICKSSDTIQVLSKSLTKLKHKCICVCEKVMAGRSRQWCSPDDAVHHPLAPLDTLEVVQL